MLNLYSFCLFFKQIVGRGKLQAAFSAQPLPRQKLARNLHILNNLIFYREILQRMKQ